MGNAGFIPSTVLQAPAPFNPTPQTLQPSMTQPQIEKSPEALEPRTPHREARKQQIHDAVNRRISVSKGC